ncbi:IucA/IucC family protein [Brevibacillus humidisoli]|uniref:IucA/IucC family protein n=1 Tax=Brevibacillus humidisoli TaxID=2895522 RepID=UPI001E5EE620|nr:IucA/IucC family protein [Brevibacillus humidisoli]UFJ39450.1 IucA/IucC family protein [Brevibacillus humidisoli]
MKREENGPGYSATPYDHVVDEAEQRVMEDLVNALLAEQLLDGHDEVERLSQADWERIVRDDVVMAAVDRRLAYADKQVSIYRWWLERGRAMIVFPVHPAITQPFRYDASEGVFQVRLDEGDPIHLTLTELGPLELMQHLIRLYADDPVTVNPGEADRFLQMLQQTLLQTSWSLETKRTVAGVLELPPAASLLELERRAALRDRPFHPVSKGKLGWTQQEYRRYTAEFGTPIQLNWMAVKRQYLVSGRDEDGIDIRPVDMLLDEEQRDVIREEMSRRGLRDEQYIAVPVHPWQMSAVLPKQLHQEIERGVCVPLDSAAGTCYATSSIRSLLSENEGNYHVKLPLGIHSLGAVRYLSAIKLINGQRAERLMRQGVQQDPFLQKRLFLCDETHWWAYLPENRDLFADYPRHLSAMIRQYPAECIEDDTVRLMPMSALAVFDQEGHLFDEWLRMCGLQPDEGAVLRLFREVLLLYYEICFRLFRLGMMPEVHGQNCVLIWKQGKIEGLLLRDHDALRLHVPWLNAHGLEDPSYRLRLGYPNSLYHETPQQLLAYFQTLGIQVNSYAILSSLSRYYGIKEERLWAELQQCLEQAVIMANLPDAGKEILQECLFDKASWPWKQIIRPLLKHHPRVPGSMPSGMGEGVNPFQARAILLPKEVVHRDA